VTKTVDDFIFTVRSRGDYTFTLQEIRTQVAGSKDAITLALNRAVRKNKIVSVRKGFYVIIPPEYSNRGIIPVTYFIDDLMKWLRRSYYMGLYSAAAMLGAGHQQPMESYIVIHKPPLRSIRNTKLIINYLVKTLWDEKDILQLKTDMGYLPISSPELTALDLLYYQHKGGINRALIIIEELAEYIKPEVLLETSIRYPFAASVQRLGYLCEYELGIEKLYKPLNSFISHNELSYARLSTNHPKKGSYNSKWKIVKNILMESEL
jgi:predicted transcriptional regulator of viral defense system